MTDSNCEDGKGKRWSMLLNCLLIPRTQISYFSGGDIWLLGGRQELSSPEIRTCSLNTSKLTINKKDRIYWNILFNNVFKQSSQEYLENPQHVLKW